MLRLTEEGDNYNFKNIARYMLIAEHQPITQINWGGHKTTVGGVNIVEYLPVTQINWGGDNYNFQNMARYMLNADNQPITHTWHSEWHSR